MTTQDYETDSQAVLNDLRASYDLNVVKRAAAALSLRPTCNSSGSIDWSTASTFLLQGNSNGISVDFSNAQDGQTIIVRVIPYGGSVAWPAGVLWPNGTAPTATPAGTDIFTFVNIQGTIFGAATQAMA